MEIYKPIYHWRAYITGYRSVLKYVWFNWKKKKFHARFSWTNIPVQEAKASRKFGVLRSFRYESNRNRLLKQIRSHHWCQLSAAKKTRVQVDNLRFGKERDLYIPVYWNTSWIAYTSVIIHLQVLLFNIYIWVNFINLPIDHLHKLISPLFIEFIMKLRLQYMCVY